MTKPTVGSKYPAGIGTAQPAGWKGTCELCDWESEPVVSYRQAQELGARHGHRQHLLQGKVESGISETFTSTCACGHKTGAYLTQQQAFREMYTHFSESHTQYATQLNPQQTPTDKTGSAGPNIQTDLKKISTTAILEIQELRDHAQSWYAHIVDRLNIVEKLMIAVCEGQSNGDR